MSHPARAAGGRALSRTERVAAICLAFVWLAGGALGAFFAWRASHWLLLAGSAFALSYGLAWLRVARRSRLLGSWSELAAPWRSLRK